MNMKEAMKRIEELEKRIQQLEMRPHQIVLSPVYYPHYVPMQPNPWQSPFWCSTSIGAGAGGGVSGGTC